MVEEYRGFKIGDFIRIHNYAGCALWWYVDAYKAIDKKPPSKACEDTTKVWQLKEIISPFEISSYDQRTLFYLESGDLSLIVETFNVLIKRPCFEKMNTYFLKYNNKP